MFIQWRSKFEIGVRQIDEEHKHLALLVNDFYDLHRSRATSGNLFTLFNELVRYVETHFQHEEELMASSDYPMLLEHKAMHFELAQAIFSLNEKYSKGQGKITDETMEFLKKWLLDHIVEQDMRIGEHIKKKKLSEGKN